MTVFVVLYGMDFEGYAVAAVCSTRELAEKAIREHKKGTFYDNYYIEEQEVQ